MVESWNSDPASNFSMVAIFSWKFFNLKICMYLLKGASTVPRLKQASELVHYCQHECVNYQLSTLNQLINHCIATEKDSMLKF